MYENTFTGKDKSIVGKPVSIIVNRGLYLGEFKSGNGRTFDRTTQIGVLTGYFSVDNDKNHFVQIKFTKSINGYSFGYAKTFDLYLFENSGHVQAQNELDTLLKYHQSIIEKNLLCARGIQIAESVGVSLPVVLRQKLFNLQAKLINRNNALKNSKHIDNIQEGEHPQLSAYNQALVTFMNNPGIGFVISTTAVIVILAIVSTASAAIAYGIFKVMNKEAKADFALSNELTSDLFKYLPPQVYEQLMKENAANKKAANEAIENARGGGIMQSVKTGALILAGVWIADKFIFNSKK